MIPSRFVTLVSSDRSVQRLTVPSRWETYVGIGEKLACLDEQSSDVDFASNKVDTGEKRSAEIRQLFAGEEIPADVAEAINHACAN